MAVQDVVEVFLQIGQGGLARLQVAQRVVVAVGGAKPAETGSCHGADSCRALVAQLPNDGVENGLCDLDHFGRCLVGLLVLQQVGGLFVKVDAGHAGLIADFIGTCMGEISYFELAQHYAPEEREE